MAVACTNRLSFLDLIEELSDFLFPAEIPSVFLGKLFLLGRIIVLVEFVSTDF